MKNVLRLFIGFCLFSIVGCAPKIPLSLDFYNSNKIKIVLNIDSVSFSKSGSQGLLDMALTPGSKFRKPLKEVESELRPIIDSTVKASIAKVMKDKNKSFEFVNEKIDLNNLEAFEKPDDGKKYAKYDCRKLKSVLSTNEVMLINVNYGLLVSYYGAFETGKESFGSVNTQIVNLNDNTLMQQETFMNKSRIGGKWDGGENYKNLKTAILVSVGFALDKLKEKFYSN